MAEPPCSPWRVAETRGDARPDVPGAPSPYTGTALDLDAGLFRLFAAHDIGPEQVDEWEPWQAAEVLEGVLDRAHMAAESAKMTRKGRRRTPKPRTARVTGIAPVPSGRDVLAARVAAARGEAPPPEPRAPGPDLAALLAVVAATEDEPTEE